MPLAFWDGIVGKFMFFLPVTLILTLMSSLLVAYIINPVFAVQFMKPEPETPEEIQTQKTRSRRSLLIASAIFAVLGIILHLAGSTGLANFVLFIVPLLWINRIVLGPMIERFQNHTWPSVQDKYEQLLRWCLQGRRPAYMMLGTAGLLVLSFVLTGLSVNSGRVKIAFFPTGEPNFVYVYLNTPIGTRAEVTDSLTQLVETKVMDVLGPRNPLVESVVTNVAIGAGDPMDQDQSVAPHKGKVTVAFIAFGDRDGMRTLPLLDSIRARIKGIPGVEIAVDQERGGPPTGKPINIEVTGQDFKVLGQNAQALKTYLDSCNIAGVEELKIDLERSKPELLVRIDRERAQREGVSTAQIGSEIRSAVFGKEASKFRSNNDEIPIQLRYSRVDREDLNRLLNARITFRDMNAGGAVRQLPVSAVANIEYTSSLGSIKRKNEKRVVTLSSNVLSGFTPNQVVASINEALKGFEATEGTGIRMTGEQEEQAEAGSFLSNALMISVGLIFMILMFQFNSMNRTLMILSEILFSIIGVLLGYVITGMTMSIIMTGIGIVALAGIVVKNGILIVEFIDLIRKEQRIPLREAIVQAGKIRLAPVFLTAASTVLGLVPLALGLNIDFPGLFARFEPHLYLGGDQVAFFGPLSWTIIFGLTFSTLITLILLPAMYYIAERNTVRRRWFLRRVSRMAYR
jgi:multidrug efflux pump subunit AcrB